MQIQVNGQTLELAQDSVTITTLLDQLGYTNRFVAVAVNQDCISRQNFASYQLNPRDQVEILAPMAGG